MRVVVLAVALVAVACTSSKGSDAPASSAPPATTTTSPAPSTSAAPSPTTSAPPRPADWPTYHGDNQRTGVATGLSPVRGTPRQVTSLRLDGAVYASPVVA